ncbi:g11672 [Coccomyxa viridis]|uniref:G11672 protein n=1 Tax=Coccomyxa viridis TaxID=1274662 RepID=A0ABP1GB37_9CHLO
MRRSASVDLKRSPHGSKSSFQELLNGKWRVLTSPALLSSAVVSALGLFMLINLCTLAMRQQAMLDIFNLPSSSSSQVHVSIKKATGTSNVAFRSDSAVQDALPDNQGNQSNRVVIGTQTLLGPECKNLSAEVLPKLQLQQSWKPGRFMQDPKMEFALVTHLGMERLDLLALQCRAWMGRVAAVLYAPMMKGKVVSWHQRLKGRSVLDLNKVLSSFYDELDPLNSCNLEMQLWTEEVESEVLGTLLPNGALRNLALKLANTEVVVLADIHELPSLSLSQELLRPRKLSMVKQILDEGVAMLVPTFATSPSLPAEEGSRLARLLVSGKKEAVLKAWDEGKIVIPDDGHPGQLSSRAIDHRAWMRAETNTYEIEYEEGFEPVVLVLAKDVTWYDERFRGPFGARTAQALDMSQHLTFEVNPLDFAVHIPFAEPEHVRMSADAVYDQEVELYAEVHKDVAASKYTPIARESCTLEKHDIYAPPGFQPHEL